MLQAGINDPDAVKLRWDAVTREHIISYTGWDAAKHVATYPTLQFLKARELNSVGLPTNIS